MPSLFASYLRVYEPLTAFDRERQVFWRRYAREGRALGPVEGPVRQRTAVLEALGAGWTRLPDLPDEAYVLECGRHPAGLPVEPAAAGRRGGAERPRRRARRCWPTPSCRRCWPARPRRSWRTGAAAPRCWSTGCRGCTSRSPPGACRCAGSSSSTWTSARSRCQRRRPADAALPHGDLQGPPARAPGGLGAAQVAGRRPDHRGGRGGHPVAGGVPPALDRRAGLRRPGQPAPGRRPGTRTIRPGWWPPGCPRCPAATPRRPPRRTRSSSRGGARSSFSSAATDLAEIGRTGTDCRAVEALPRRILFVISAQPKRDIRTKRDTIWRRKNVKIGHASTVYLGTFGRSAHVGHRGLAGP